jgi:hypothetical protein
MKYPTFDAVSAASHEQLARWHRFLPVAETFEQRNLVKFIGERLAKLGGITDVISKKIGWEEPQEKEE